MAAVINIRGTSQAHPITSPASIQIDFTVLGILPDKVQVYEGGVSGGLSRLVDEVDMTPPEIDYSSSFQLPGGTAFVIHLCPRTTTDGIPDDKLDEQFFESFCTRTALTTLAPPPPGPRPKPPAPRITSLEPHQATLHDEGDIVAHWTAVTNFDQFHVIAGETGGPPGEVEIDSPGTNGFFRLTPTIPGRQYAFKVQGCITHTIGLNDCSLFTIEQTVTMPPNTRSLREFLRLSRVSLERGVRSIGGPGVSSVRAMMRL